MLSSLEVDRGNKKYFKENEEKKCGIDFRVFKKKKNLFLYSQRSKKVKVKVGKRKIKRKKIQIIHLRREERAKMFIQLKSHRQSCATSHSAFVVRRSCFSFLEITSTWMVKRAAMYTLHFNFFLYAFPLVLYFPSKSASTSSISYERMKEWYGEVVNSPEK